jgi:hypothetical protein
MSRKMEQAPFTLTLSEQGDVVIIVGADRINLGRDAPACEEMYRFLADVDHGRSGTDHD